MSEDEGLAPAPEWVDRPGRPGFYWVCYRLSRAKIMTVAEVYGFKDEVWAHVMGIDGLCRIDMAGEALTDPRLRGARWLPVNPPEFPSL